MQVLFPSVTSRFQAWWDARLAHYLIDAVTLLSRAHADVEGKPFSHFLSLAFSSRGPFVVEENRRHATKKKQRKKGKFPRIAFVCYP